MGDPEITETHLREEIAARPSLVEVGLTTVAKNYHLPNSEGTRGYVDVFARDRHGAFVVIEIKRSDSTAREAIHEVLKYCELLRAERGLRRDQLRAIIVSTKWRELLVPFSEISRVSQYPIEGMQLIVDAGSLESLRAERVNPLPVPVERDLSALALRLPLESPDQASRLWPTIVRVLADLGIDDTLGILIGNESRTLLHVALGTVVEGDPRLPTPPADEEEFLEEAPEGQEKEYLVALHAVGQLPDAELVSPERLTRIMNSNRLEVLSVLRAGRYEDQADLIDDDEAVRLAEGTTGWNQVMVTLTGRPSHSLAWRRLRSRLHYALFGNPRWTRLMKLWLDEIEQTFPSGDVVLHVYNPCDLLAALVHSGLGGELPRLLPQIEGGLDLPGSDGRLLHGTLVWDGTSAATASAAIRSVYASPGDWGMARASGGVWADDLQMLEALGLDYALFEFAPDGVGGPWLLDEQEEALARLAPSGGEMEWPGCRPLPEWLQEVDLADLMQEYRRVMTPVSGGDQWLVVDGPRPESEH
jgi:hypothetical protein